MYFEHLVAVNDPANPLLSQISRAQLWKGLMRRALNASEFVEALDEDVELAAGEGYSERAWRYGSYQARVRIEFRPEQQLDYLTHPLPDNAGGSLSMRIEEPAPGHLFVRFVYQTPLSEAPVDGVDVAAYLKSAYCQGDADMIRRIRQLAEAGAL